MCGPLSQLSTLNRSGRDHDMQSRSTYTPVGGPYEDTTCGLDLSLDWHPAFHDLLYCTTALTSGPTTIHPLMHHSTD